MCLSVCVCVCVFFSRPRFVFFKEECVEFNMRWLTDELEIDPDEITLIEDVWAGGGNMGPSIEYFISGLELGNMVFMQVRFFVVRLCVCLLRLNRGFVWWLVAETLVVGGWF